jgi:hypothetical protein
VAARRPAEHRDRHEPRPSCLSRGREAQFHPKGSAIEYRYKAEDGAGVDPSAPYEARRAPPAQRYPKRVLYGNSVPLSLEEPDDARNEWHYELVFDYGEHDLSPDEERAWPARSDPFSAYRLGFEVRTHRLCRRVLVFHRFAELGPRACLVGATELGHRVSSAGAELETITYRGYRRDLSSGAMDERALPPLRFTYEHPSIASSFQPAEATDHLPSGIDERYRLVDLNGEGLPGILTSNGAAWYYKENLGGGRFGPMELVPELPSGPPAFSLGDFDSDGNLELAGFEGREAGWFDRDRDEARWSGFQAFARIARADFANGRVQVFDLNGDGRGGYTELLRFTSHESARAHCGRSRRGAVEERNAAIEGTLTHYLASRPLTRAFSLRQEFSQAFHRLLESDPGTAITVDVGERHFPLFLQGRRLTFASASLVVVVEEERELGSFSMSLDGAVAEGFARSGTAFAAFRPERSRSPAT